MSLSPARGKAPRLARGLFPSYRVQVVAAAQMPPKDGRHGRSGKICQVDPRDPSALRAAERDLQRQRRLLQQRRRRILQFVEDVALLLFVWTCPDTTLCQAYLESEKIAADTSGVTLKDIERRYLSLSSAQINGMMDKATTVGARTLQKAERFKREFALARWIETENSKKGNAPTAALVQVHMSQSTDLVSISQEDMAVDTPVKVSTKWVQRFRKRWRLARGRFVPRDHLPLNAVREKAPVSN